MTTKPVRSRRLVRKLRERIDTAEEELSPLSQADRQGQEQSRSPRSQLWHDRLTLFVGGLASIAAIASVMVAQKQADLMDQARNDAVAASRAAGEDTKKSLNFAGKQVEAATKQALALSQQVAEITAQLEISKNQVASSQAQARAMQSLASASALQAASTTRLVQASREQLAFQTNAYSEARRASINLEFVNAEMAGGMQWTYDVALPITIRLSISNLGQNPAVVFATIDAQIIEGRKNITAMHCPEMNCSGLTPVIINGIHQKNTKSPFFLRDWITTLTVKTGI